MKRKIDAFCRQHPNFGIPNLIKYITIADVVIWLLNMVNPRIVYYMTFDPRFILQGQVWRLISFVFIPQNFGVLALITFYLYYMIGTTLERSWGTGQFTIFLFSGIILTIIYGFLIYFIAGMRVSLTADYVFLSMFFSFAALYPDMQLLLFFVIPIKMKWLALVDGVLFLAGVISMPFPANLLPLVAILNFFIFCGEDLKALLHIGGAKRSPTVINFRRETKQIRREQAKSLYHHKCSVCGRTDTDYPNLEFRYCSKCAGYHCFCEEHINSHIHFT